MPADLIEAVGKKWLVRSLRTHDMRTAQRAALCLMAGYAQAFRIAAGRGMGKDDEDALKAGLASLYGDTAKRWEIEGTTPSGQPFKIKTNGTAEDNASGERAVASMFESDAYRKAVASINMPALVPRSAPAGPTLEDALTLYFSTEVEGKNARTMRARKRAAWLFADFDAVGRKRPVVEVSKAQAVAWIDHLRTMGGVAKPTAANMASHVRTIFTWLVERGEANGNPFERVGSFKPKEKKQRRREGFGWEPFDTGTLRALFDPANLGRTRMDHVRWGAVLGLYTGARVGEVAQLCLRDFVEREGHPCLMIRAEAQGQSVKTDASARIIPLHPDLIRLGLLDEVERRRAREYAAAQETGGDGLAASAAANNAQFFAIRLDANGGGVGNAVSKGFIKYIGGLGVRPRRENGRVGFHSFRKTMTQTLQGTSVPSERRRAFLGHEPGDDDAHAVDYMRPWTAGEVAAVFEGIRWGEWLDFDGLQLVLSQGQKGQRRAVKRPPPKKSRKR
ncbi:hypothetical protein IMW82_00180 [Rhodanobacter sp. B2A1Ga4]|nr:hypothetical protein [Rhodanobacter sp. B2A1Ga4]